jgi:hypothetical protein
MNIDVQFDSSTTGAPAGFFTAVNAAAAYWDREIINPITVTIVFGYNEVDGQTIGNAALAESESNGNTATYAQVKSGLVAAATSANDAISISHLPSSDPSNGAGFFITLAEAEVLGLASTANTTVGFAGLSSAFPFTFDPNNRAVPGDYDAVGAMEHEISEVLGRIAGSGMGSPPFSPLDLFRYASPGHLALTPEAASFSIDGSNFLLPFNNPMNGGDAGDWASSVIGDSFGSGSKDTAGLISPTDLTVMDVLGYTLAPTTRNDFNGDGVSDILWRDTNGSIGLWGSKGGGGFSGFSGQGLGSLSSSWTAAQTGDFAGNGKSDILWRNSNGDVGLWLSNAGTGFSGHDLGVVGNDWSIQGVGDFASNGKADILWRDTNGDVGIWMANGGPGFTGFTGQDLGIVSSNWTIQQVGDFTGDGKADILWRNSTNGDVEVWLANSGAGFTGFTGHDLGVVSSGSTIQQVGDFNGDGKADILWRNTNGDVGLWLSNAGAGFTGFTGQDLGVVGGSWSIQNVGDYNGDGKADILWRNTNGDVFIWQSNSGPGFNGFTGYDGGVVTSDWTIVGNGPSPPLGASAVLSSGVTAAAAQPAPNNSGATVSDQVGAAVTHTRASADQSQTTHTPANAITSGLLAGDLLHFADRSGATGNILASWLSLGGPASLAVHPAELDSFTRSSPKADPANDGTHIFGLEVTDPSLSDLHAHSGHILFG